MSEYKPISTRSELNKTYNRSTVKRFYTLIRYHHFATITQERMKKLDEIIEKWRYFFEQNADGYRSKMTFVAEKLITSSKQFGLLNDDEKLYFYVKMVDPNFYFLEAYESANTHREFIELCMLNFHFVDSILTFIEREINDRFRIFNDDELWALDRIDKNISSRNESMQR